ncbi:MAG: hypothetical protein LC779_04605 [Actinobacteria bacterium]|nr:hypothetical protein [Actinomycetota bacterium]
MKAATALLTALAASLWLAWATRDYHDNQRNWLLWMALLMSAFAALSLLPLALRPRRQHRG